MLGLDAALVAVAWQLLMVRQLGPLPAHYTPALGLTVWTIYLADRLLDTRRPEGRNEPLRHRFSRRARMLLGLLIVFNLAVLTQLGPLPVLEALPLIGAVGLYFLTVHFLRAGQRWPKELVVATLFALGVSLPLYPFPFTLDFLFLCFWNCTAIEYWERGKEGLHPASAWLAERLGSAAVVAGLVCLGCAPVFNMTVQLTLAATFGLCALLVWMRRWLSPLALRVAADLVLLTPLLVI